MKTILISTYNSNIIPELLGVFNRDTVPFYKDTPADKYIDKLAEKYNFERVHELWLITTSLNTGEMEDEIRQLYYYKSFPVIRIWYPKGVEDVNSIEAVNAMKELIFRLVFSAKNIAEHLYLSLTGGRKSMSSDIQQAAGIFGTDLLFHILQKEERNSNPDNFFPVIIDSGIKPKSYVNMIDIEKYGINHRKIEKQIVIKSFANNESSLVLEVNKLRKKSENLLVNYENEHQESKRENFHKLNFLSPDIIVQLKSYRIGIDLGKKVEEMGFLRKLPKTELHCHFGGIANPSELYIIANSNAERIEYWIKKDVKFASWIEGLKKITLDNNISMVDKKDLILRKYVTAGIKLIPSIFSYIEEPVCVSALIRILSELEGFLEFFIYGEFLNKEKFIGIGIDEYASLGDLQGSSILQSKESIETCCEILINNCNTNNIKYIEIRLSPHKYTRSGLSEKDVIDIIMGEFVKSKIEFRIILIAGRDKDTFEIKGIIDVILKLTKEDKLFRNKFGGIDLAGPENVRSAKELRDLFLPVMEICPNITIHAGEGESVESIWQAVYHLNADRIGHGLTLGDNISLLNKFINKNISVEMCPSSNLQIVGFKDKDVKSSKILDEYPLKKYLDKGLLVTINTDDPGISMTTLSEEYYKAARLTNKGLSIWELLQIVRNGFKSGFVDYFTRKRLIEKSENEIFKIIENGEYP